MASATTSGWQVRCKHHPQVILGITAATRNEDGRAGKDEAAQAMEGLDVCTTAWYTIALCWVLTWVIQALNDRKPFACLGRQRDILEQDMLGPCALLLFRRGGAIPGQLCYVLPCAVILRQDLCVWTQVLLVVLPQLVSFS
jgi:hypothetical protein